MSIFEKEPRVKEILEEVFKLMDANGDGGIDEDEGVAIGMAMGESEEVAKNSWKAMCKDMDDDGNTTIELPEWLAFYDKTLSDPKVDPAKVVSTLEGMKKAIAEQVKK